jgi:hypothetical protein
MISLGTVTLSSNASSVAFSNLNQDYKDLRIVMTGQTTDLCYVLILPNGSTGNSKNFSFGANSGNGGTGEFFTGGIGVCWGGGYFSNTETAIYVSDFYDYSTTGPHKGVITRGGNAGVGVETITGRYESSGTITSININSYGGLFKAGSSFTVYGIAG